MVEYTKEENETSAQTLEKLQKMLEDARNGKVVVTPKGREGFPDAMDEFYKSLPRTTQKQFEELDEKIKKQEDYIKETSKVKVEPYANKEMAYILIGEEFNYALPILMGRGDKASNQDFIHSVRNHAFTPEEEKKLYPFVQQTWLKVIEKETKGYPKTDYQSLPLMDRVKYNISKYMKKPADTDMEMMASFNNYIDDLKVRRSEGNTSTSCNEDLKKLLNMPYDEMLAKVEKEWPSVRENARKARDDLNANKAELESILGEKRNRQEINKVVEEINKAVRKNSKKGKIYYLRGMGEKKPHESTTPNKSKNMTMPPARVRD